MNEASEAVGFDGSYFDQATTGSGQYSSQLWRAFECTEDSTPHTRLLRPIFGAEQQPVEGAVEVQSPTIVRRNAKAGKLWWEQRGLVQAARQAGVQAIHTPYFAAPLLGNLPVIVTIHDVIPYVHPAYRNSASMRLYLKLVSHASRRAAAIITDSECSRRDIERYLGIDRVRITVIPLAADERYRPERDPDAENELRARFALPGPIVFNVGGLDVRKNVGALVRGFAKALPDLDPTTRLVIAGHAHTGNQRLYPSVEPLIRELGVERHVVLTGRISEAEKLRLYNMADLYVFTSLYEGFGLSPLEAMACGTPVVCSNRSSLPEVVGEGGLLIDPEPDRIAGSISALMNDRHRRHRLGQLGLEQASRFSWQRTASMTLDVYRRVLAET